ncbi:hypothetical protein ANN_08353 [Periplaneta americana]|uniref:Uncharacterized protein n=1 Tax=Periplaneta americana TaxID=6978 RepID=A0ABQ8T168_PERAM|nr:hypothetical protein ANN_08353 [Periplaneta americana]
MAGLREGGNESQDSLKAIYIGDGGNTDYDDGTNDVVELETMTEELRFCRSKKMFRNRPRRAKTTSRLLASRPHIEAEVDDHATRMEVSCG